MVAIDATVFTLFVRPDSPGPSDVNGKPIEYAAARVEHLIDELSDAGVTIIIPTPALSEALVRTDTADAAKIVEELQKHSAFRLESFDALAAIELASMTRDALRRGKKRDDPAVTWAKLKFDQQIVAIAKVHQATTIYSDDGHIRTIAGRAGIQVVGIADLDLPPETAQFDAFELSPGG